MPYMASCTFPKLTIKGQSRVLPKIVKTVFAKIGKSYPNLLN